MFSVTLPLSWRGSGRRGWKGSGHLHPPLSQSNPLQLVSRPFSQSLSLFFSLSVCVHVCVCCGILFNSTCACAPCHSGPGWGLFGVCVMRLRAPACGWGVVVVSAAALLLLTAIGLALALILTRESQLRLRS